LLNKISQADTHSPSWIRRHTWKSRGDELNLTSSGEDVQALDYFIRYDEKHTNK